MSEKYEKYLMNTYSGKRLREEYDISTYGTWQVIGEGIVTPQEKGLN